MDHLFEGGLIALLEAIHQQLVKCHVLGFHRHTFHTALMGVFLNCSGVLGLR
jgi:hypothetical protein